jgi:hypothetical protein
MHAHLYSISEKIRKRSPVDIVGRGKKIYFALLRCDAV